MQRRAVILVALVVAAVGAGGLAYVALGDDDERRAGALQAKKISKVKPVAAKKLHGAGFFGNSRLGKIENGTVPCVHSETGEAARCAFSKRANSSGAWLESGSGHFARVGQGISLDGKPGGPYVIAAEIAPDGTVPTLDPAGRDSAGISTDKELNGACLVEVAGSALNASGQPLVNHATLEVPTRDNPHPDNAKLIRSTADGVHYYTGPGAALNDINGAERDSTGTYYSEPERCHYIWSGGYEVPASKRPATAYGRINPKTPIVWRPVSPNINIANER